MGETVGRRYDEPVVVVASATDPGDMGEPREFWSDEDKATVLIVPAARLWSDAEAGHRTPEPHDCFLMTCARLGDEVRRLQVQVTEAAQAARAEVIAERFDVAVLAQAIDNVTDRTRNAFVGSHVMARYLIEEYLALLPPTEPKP